MSAWDISFVSVLSAVLLAAIYVSIRNWRVLEFRVGLIRQVSKAAQDDIDAGDFNWQWRYDAIEVVSYERMLLSFKRLTAENYYADRSFLWSKARAS
jgi:hypothetical protein